MALPKPQKSKAPAPTQPVGGYHSHATKDSCCIPVSTPSNTSWTGSNKNDTGHSAVHHILNPTAH
jgi:hypothetical protein